MNGVRLGAILEWLLAIACIAAALTVGSALLDQARPVGAVETSAADGVLPDIPDGIPPRSVLVPLLLLDDGTEVRVGDSAAAMPPRIRASEVRAGGESESPRVTRFYTDYGRRFAIVFAGDRIEAIYLH